MPAKPQSLGLNSADPVRDAHDQVYCSDFFAASDSGVAQLLNHPLTAEWEALAIRTLALPFLRPQWVAAWWRAFAGDQCRLALWYARRNGRLTALLPVLQQHDRLISATNYHTPQSGLLAESNDIAALLVRTMLLQSGASEVVLAGLDTLGADPGICHSAARDAGHRTLVLPHERACFIPTGDGWDAYEKNLGKDFRSDVRRCKRHLQESGTLAIEIGNGQENLCALLDAALAIEAAGWKRRNGTAILSSPREERFYRDLARWAAAEHMLRLCFLRLDGKPLAMLLALEHQRTWHLLKTGYDENYQQYSPGKLLLHDCIHHCFKTGMARIEIHGDTQQHKLRWRPQGRTLQRFHMFAPSIKGRLAWAAVVLRPWVKSLLVRYKLLQG